MEEGERGKEGESKWDAEEEEGSSIFLGSYILTTDIAAESVPCALSSAFPECLHKHGYRGDTVACTNRVYPPTMVAQSMVGASKVKLIHNGKNNPIDPTEKGVDHVRSR